MALDIVGAGLGRTGTLSLKHALEQLGFDKTYHMFEVAQNPEHRDTWSAARRGEPVDWDALFEGYRASVDWPACDFWQELSEHYPESKVLLSVRDPERWYASIRNTIHLSTAAGLTSEDETARKQAEWGNWMIWEANFDDRMDDKDHVIGVYEARTALVKATIPSDRLLVYETGSGWGPLCEFFDVPVPDDPYPHVNTTEEFRERFGRRNA
ncbi:MAG: sulfotransferase family protein [Chloroflexi bacterium]|nr:sulfotransferase family protein [Chloroflexota bacterium]